MELPRLSFIPMKKKGSILTQNRLQIPKSNFWDYNDLVSGILTAEKI